MPLSFLAVASLRLLSRVILWQVRSVGYNLRHVVVVGVGEQAQDVVRRLETRSSLGLRVVGVVSEDLSGPEYGGSEQASMGPSNLLGGLDKLYAMAAENTVDQVIVALPLEKLGLVAELMENLKSFSVEVKLIPDVMQHATLCGSIEEMAGLPAFNLQGNPLGRAEIGLKRGFDITFALFLGLISLPIFGVIALVVRASSVGPVFYRQVRVGLDGERFNMFKFRTMAACAEADGPTMTQATDPRCTPIGRFLRRYSLDELPQLWNVLTGDMSLVGPRPEQPVFASELAQQIPRYALRHRVKAGMTGWAQVNGLRGNTCMNQRVEHDLYYIENWSMLFDLRILVRTILGGFLSHNAY